MRRLAFALLVAGCAGHPAQPPPCPVMTIEIPEDRCAVLQIKHADSGVVESMCLNANDLTPVFDRAAGRLSGAANPGEKP